jgi:WD40 repeat protein
MAVGATDGTIKIWNLTDDTLLENLQAHKGEADLLSFSENGYYFSSGSR